MNDSAIKAIIQYAIDFDPALLSKKDVATITNYFIDYVGVTIAGAQEIPSQRAQKLALELGKKGSAGVLGSKYELSSPWACFANGVACHILDWDDMYWDGLCHIGSFVFNPALALCQELGLSGRKLVTTAFLAYEFAMRLSRLQIGEGNAAEVPQKGFDVSSTVGTLTSAFVAAKLMQLPFGQFVHAIGLAVNQASGVYQAIRENGVTHSFAFHHGWAAFSGVVAAQLAQKGFQSDENAVLGDFGYMNSFSVNDQWQKNKNIADLATRLYKSNSIKRYPACAYVCSALTALFSCIEKYSIRFEDIQHVKLFVTNAAYDMCYLPEAEKLQPRSPEVARLSMPFCIASAIYDRKFTPSQTNQQSINDRKKLELATAIQILRDMDLSNEYAEGCPVKIIISCSGSAYEFISTYEHGHYFNPMSQEDQKAKFISATSGIIDNPGIFINELESIFERPNLRALMLR